MSCSWGDESRKYHFYLKAVRTVLHCGESEELGGPGTVDGKGEELSWSQCSSSIDSLSWWKEAFPYLCSPLSLSSTQMIRLPTSRCSPSTTPMSSLSSSKVSWHSNSAYLWFSICCFLLPIYSLIMSLCYYFYQCCAQRQTSTQWLMPPERWSHSVVLTCESVF